MDAGEQEVSETLKKVYEMIKDDDSDDKAFALQQAEMEKTMALRASSSGVGPDSPPANRRISALFGPHAAASSGPIAQRSSRADDVQFAAEVSENLLLECRRQQVQIKQLEQEKGSVAGELELLRQKLSQAEAKIDASGSQQEQLREANWSLELQLQETQALLAKQGDAATKWTSEAAKLRTAESGHLDQIDQLTSTNDELSGRARAAAAKHDADVQNLRKQVEELEDELTAEKTRAAQLESTLKRQTVFNAPQLGAPRPAERAANESDDLATPTNSPPMSPIKATPHHSVALQDDTHKATLSHYQRQIQTLRTALQREKTEKIELKRQLGDLPAGAKKKKVRAVPRTAARPLSFNKPQRSSTSLSTDEEDEFDFVSAPESIYESADGAIAGAAHIGLGLGSASPSTDFFSVDENLSETDSGQETPTGEVPAGTPRTSFFRRIFTKSPGNAGDTSIDTLAPLSKEMMSPDELAETLSDEALAAIAEKHGFKLAKPETVLHAGFVAVSDAEYAELSSRPAVRGDDVVVLSKDEYSNLVHPGVDVLRAHAESADHVLLESAAHRALVDPSFEDWAAKTPADKAVVDASELAALHTPTLDTLKAQLDGQQHVAVPWPEHHALLHPSIDAVRSHAASQGYQVVQNDEHHALLHPGIDAVRSYAAAMNYQVVQNDEHHALLHPTLDAVRSQAESQGHVLLGKSEHEALVSPALDAVFRQAEAHGHVVVPKEEHAALASPDIDAVRAQAERHGHVVVPKDEHEALVNPDFDALRSLADKHEHVVVSKDEHAALASPDLEAVRAHAERQGHVVVSKDEHAALASPDLEAVRAHAERQGHVVVSKDDHSALVNPDLEAVRALAGTHEHILLHQSEHERLRRPSLDTIRGQLDLHNHVMVPREEHDQLVDPALEKVAEFAIAKHHVVVPEDEFDRLRSPSFMAIGEQAKKHNHVLVAIDEYQKLSEPDVADLRSRAAGLHHVLLSDAEYQQLAEPGLDRVAEHAKSHHHVLLAQAEYDALANPSLDRVKERAGDFKHIAVPLDEYHALQHPSLDAVRSQANSLNAQVVLNDEHHALVHPSRDALPALASAHGMTVVADDELARLRREAQHPTQSELEQHAAELDLAVVPQPEYDHAKQHGLVVLSRDEHEALVSPSRETVEQHLERAKPSLEVVRGLAAHHGRVLAADDADGARSLAAQHGLVVVTAESLEELQHPPLPRALQSLKRLGYAGLPVDELDLLQQRADTPSVDELKQRAGAHGLAVVAAADADELAKLRAMAADPTALDVEEIASKRNCVAVPRDVYERLEETSKHPDAATVARFAYQLGLETMPAVELNELRARVGQPTREDVDAWARANQFVTVPVDEYDRLVAQAESRRKQADLATLSVAERRQHFESLIENSRTPTKALQASPHKGERMTETLKSLGYVPLPQDEYRRLLASQTVYEPTKGDIIRGARTFGMTALPTDEYRGLLASRPREDEVHGPEPPRTPQRNTRADDSVLLTPGDDDALKAVPSEYLETLRRIAEAPTREDLDGMAKRLGLELYGPDEVLRNDDEEIRSAAKSLGLVDPLGEEAIKERALAAGLIEPLSEEAIKEKALAAGLVEPLSEEAIKEKALAAGLVEPLSEEAIKEKALAAGLIEPLSEEAIKEKALAAGLIEPLSEEAIKERALAAGLVESLSEEAIKEKALAAGLVEPLSEEAIKEKALAAGLVEPLSEEAIKEKALAAGLVEPLSEEAIKEKALAAGLVEPLSEEAIKQRALAAGLVEPLSEAEIKQRALAAGLIEPTEEEVKKRALAAGLIEPSEAAIKQRALAAGLVVPLTQAQIIAKARAAGLADPVSQDQILARAKAAGLIEPLTAEEVKARARAVGLVDPMSDAEVLRRAKKQGWMPPLSNQELLALVRHRGLATSTPTVRSEAATTPSPASVPSAKVTPPAVASHQRSGSARSIDEFGLPVHMGETRPLPVSRRFEITRSPSTPGRSPLGRAPPRTATSPNLNRQVSTENIAEGNVRDAFNRGFAQGTSTVGISRSSSQRSLHSHAQRKNSIVPSLTSGLSLAELDHPTTMSFVTQLVIGELLYKYVSGFSFTSLTGGRHERYFWVHPYSLTLYWDKENPAVGTHRRYTGPKSAAILDITEVTDRNPMPTGLYYKSLVITTTAKSLKITCPTRRRHLIWYRGIKYLLEKAREEAEMAEKNEEEADTTLKAAE